MADTSTINLKVFYSWQSDLPMENQNAIRESLRNAYSQIEQETSDLQIINDEATRETSGTPDIPDTIFQKISESDVFICDLTTINSTAPALYRRVPNPNVAIELGYAITAVGWGRIIILFNKTFGTFPADLPFDVSKRRIMDFKITGKTDKSGKGMLRSSIVEAIKTIIIKKPLKPIEERKQTPEERKRNNDISNLRWAMNAIPIPYLDSFIEDLPLKINDRIFHFWEGFNGVITSSLFYLYDVEARELVNNFHEHWKNCFSFRNRYRTNPFSDLLMFGSNVPFSDSKGEDADLQKIEQERASLRTAFKKLLSYLRENYLEINTDETTKYAAQEYINFHKYLINDAEKQTE